MERAFEQAKAIWAQAVPLRRAGYDLIPLTAARTPWTGWRTEDYAGIEFITHLKHGGAVGVRLGPEHLVVDVDPRNGGAISFENLCFDIGTNLDSADVPAVRSGGGGLHLYYRKPIDLRTRVTLPKLYAGIDFKRAGGYIVAPGNDHPSGGVYRWLRPIGPQGAPQAPQALLDLLAHPPSAEGSAADAAPKAGALTPDELALLLCVVPASNYGPGQHEEWLAISMACHEATGGAGFDQWLDWCASDDRYSDVPTETLLGRWKSFADHRGVTRATLFKAVVDAGRPDLLRRVDARNAFDEDELFEVAGDPIDEEEVMTDPIAMLSEKHVLVLFGGKALVHYTEDDAPAFASVAAMRALYQPLMVSVKVPDGNGGTLLQRRQAFDVWMKSSKRPTAQGLTIDPKAGRITEDGKLNLWRGFTVEPKAGDWSLIRDLIEDVLCCGDKDHARYVMRWIAWKVQHATDKTDVALVFRGKKGSGKGTLARLLLSLFGSHARQVSSSKHLVGSFNGHLANALLVNADESFWAGDPNAEGVLKARITEPSMLIEPKGVDAFEAPNRIAYIITANALWVVPASEDERRFAVFTVSQKRLGDFDYFRRLQHQIANGGAAAFLHAMLKADLGDWHPREDIPQTEGLAQQQQESADPQVLWLGAILSEGMLPGYVRDESGEARRIAHESNPAMARAQLLLKHAKASDSRLRYWTQPSFNKFLEQFGVANGQRSAKGSFKRFPPLPECRGLFQQAYPWWEFETIEGDWRMVERRSSAEPWDFGPADQEEPDA